MGEVGQNKNTQMICPATDQEYIRHKINIASQIGPNIVDIGSKIANLPKGDVYRVVLSRPVGGGLNPRADGLYDAFVKGPDGKFTAVARLSRVGPSFVTSVTMLAGHAMLAQISSQLSTLQADVDLLVRLQVAGKLGKVKAAALSLKMLQYYDKSHRDQVLLSTANNLKTSIGEALGQAAELIRAVPEPPESNIRRLVFDTSPRTVQALDRARDAVTVVLLGLQALAEAEVLLNEALAAAQITRAWLSHVRHDLDLARCERLARMMQATNDEERHELFWMKVTAYLKDCDRMLLSVIDEEEPLRISFECTGGDLLHPHGE